MAMAKKSRILVREGMTLTIYAPFNLGRLRLAVPTFELTHGDVNLRLCNGQTS